MPRVALLAVVAVLCRISLVAIEPDRDFSGRWILDARMSDSRMVSVAPMASLEIAQREGIIECSAPAPGGGTARWSYRLDGSEAAAQIGNETHNSAVKWEGSALLINTLVSGPRNHVIMDRWKLSPDRAVMTIVRQAMQGTAQTEGVFVYRREGQPAGQLATRPAAAPAAVPASRPAPPQSDYMVESGAHILLRLTNSVDTKHSHEGDRIYLDTVVPVARNGRVVIPAGAHVTGTVTQTKRPGRAVGKGELYIRFDSITLPNGVTRDFRSRLGNAETKGTVDRQEGKVTGPGNQAGDARTVASTAGMGATIGGVAGAAAGHAGQGLGIGAAAEAAAGLAAVLLKRGPDAVLAKGTRVEMILDRDLHFSAVELP
jgi:type IV secretion system protein VirB10